MEMMYLFFVFALFFIRFFAGYDSRFQKGRYVVIKNRVLRAFLIDKHSFFESTNRLKKDINKMSVVGLVLYACSLLVLIINIVLQCFVPEIAIEPFEIKTEKIIIYADTLNEKISAIFIWLLLLSVIGHMMFCLTGYIKNEKKWIRILIYTVSLTMGLAIVVIAFYMISEFFV